MHPAILTATPSRACFAHLLPNAGAEVHAFLELVFYGADDAAHAPRTLVQLAAQCRQHPGTLASRYTRAGLPGALGVLVDTVALWRWRAQMDDPDTPTPTAAAIPAGFSSPQAAYRTAARFHPAPSSWLRGASTETRFREWCAAYLMPHAAAWARFGAAIAADRLEVAR